MGLPSKLKDLNMFNEGQTYLGEVKSVTLPKLGRAFEDYRGGGMNGPVKIDNGMQAIDLEWTVGGLALQVLRQFGAVKIDAVQLRFVGAYQRQDVGTTDAVEVVMRGRHEEIDPGDQEPGEDTETKIKTSCAYYKLTVNGRVEIEVDFLRGIEIVDGVDRTAEVRQIIGAA